MPDTTLLAPPSTAFATAEAAKLAPVYPLPRLELASGRGAHVRDAEGREYLDFVSGIAVNAFGHAPAGLAAVVATQLETLGQCSNLFAHVPGVALAESLTAATGFPRVFFCNSGTEGVDAALKFARARAGHLGLPGRDILAFEGGFHGRTGFALSATHHPSYRAPFEPLIPGIRFARFNDVAGLDAALDRDVCAVVVEPVQGENGAVPATREFLHALRAKADAVGAALVFDEVQTGMGRCGRLLAQEHFGVRGDLTVMSKALGAGLPIGAVLMTEEVAAALAPGMHGCTFGGNPVSCAAAGWALARVTAPGFLERVQQAAVRLGAGLAALAAKHATVSEARGLGLLTAIELAGDAGFGAPQLVASARDHGLLLIRGGERAVRLLPPLTVTDAEIDLALEHLEAALHALMPPTGDTK
ncbi:MAG TPA: aspartate aminotransferase family protein [Candidatus Acidoferrales bacterium]|nr:aspartate aminotransferase family protein [Candidatus Acidoferrales bacterium]